jgi:hypothetical protein
VQQHGAHPVTPHRCSALQHVAQEPCIQSPAAVAKNRHDDSQRLRCVLVHNSGAQAWNDACSFTTAVHKRGRMRADCRSECGRPLRARPARLAPRRPPCDQACTPPTLEASKRRPQSPTRAHICTELHAAHTLQESVKVFGHKPSANLQPQDGCIGAWYPRACHKRLYGIRQLRLAKAQALCQGGSHCVVPALKSDLKLWLKECSIPWLCTWLKPLKRRGDNHCRRCMLASTRWSGTQTPTNSHAEGTNLHAEQKRHVQVTVVRRHPCKRRMASGIHD